MQIKKAIMMGMITVNILYGAPYAGPGTNIWVAINETQEIVHNVGVLVDILADQVNNISEKEDSLGSLVDYVARESARRIDLVFNKIEAIQEGASSRLDHVVDYLQYVAVESARRIDRILNKADEIGEYTEGRLATIVSNTSTIELLAQELSEQTVRVENALNEVRENQQMLLGNVQHNGETLVQVDSKIDDIHSELDVLYTELSENDAKIFSMLDRVDTKVVVGMRNLHTQINNQAILNDDTRQPKNKNITLTQQQVDASEGLIIATPGHYILSESVQVYEKGIHITADNVFLDLAGHTIASAYDQTIPVSIEGSKIVTIAHGFIVGGQGIYVANNEDITLDQVNISRAASVGITIENTRGFFITGCKVCGSAQHGIVIDATSSDGVVQHSVIVDAVHSGIACNGACIVVEDSMMQHNGMHGISLQQVSDIQVKRCNATANGIHGICVDAQSLRVQIEGCRALGNGNIGCIDEGATQAVWMNNLSSGNATDDYRGIRSVSPSKATSYWHNVHGS